MSLDPDKEYRKIYKIKWFLICFYTLRGAVAVATFCICCWIRFDLDFRVWVKRMNWYTYWYCMYVIWFAMFFELAITGLGFFGVIRDKLASLNWAAWLMFFIGFPRR